MLRRMAVKLAAACALAPLIGSLVPVRAATLSAGDWRLAIPTPIGDLPINLSLTRRADGWRAQFRNGPETVEAESVAVTGDGLRIAFPSYGSILDAKVDAEGTMRGQITFARSDGPLTVAFTGRNGAAYRFFAKPAAANATVAGRWALTVGDPGAERHGVAEFKQNGRVVDGATMFFNADSRYLNGEVRGDELYLATFDGGQGSLWIGRRAADGSLAGKTYSLVSGGVTAWSGRPDANAKLEDPNTLTYLKPGYDRVAFTFPNLDGKPVSLDDAAYRGKVVIVTIAGSWCATCHDETTFLSPYYQQNRARGLEVIGLMYEYSADRDKAAAACRNFQKRYDIQWQMLLAGLADKAAASRTLPMINAVLAYPTMIVIDRKGAVRRIHTGFPGPATGEHHEAFKREFTAFMDQLLAEQA